MMNTNDSFTFLALYFYLCICKQGLEIKVFTNKTKIIYILAKSY